MSALPQLLFFYFPGEGCCFPPVPMALLLRCTKPNRAPVPLSVPVTYSSSLLLCFLPRSPSPPPPSFSLHELTADVRGEGCMFASGRGVKKKKIRRAEHKEQDRRIFSPSQQVSFGCLLINFVCLISRVFFSVPVL